MTDVAIKRTRNYHLQLKGSLVFKILSMLISFALIPLMIRYLGVEKYGVWSTLLSILSWILMFDLGIGNGLRNMISESIAKDDRLDAQKYISTAYVSIALVSVFLGLLFIVISSFIPWLMVFNTIILTERELMFTVNITITFVLINFLLSLVNQVVNGIQKTQVAIFNQFLSNGLSLLLIWLLSLFVNSSIIYLATAYGFSLFLSNILISIWFYRLNPDLKPVIVLFDKEYIRSIVSLGLKFFAIQIAVIILFTTDKIVITQLLGPEFVVQYDVVFKLFSVITILQGILMAPLWGAYSDAYHRGDFTWLRTMINKQLKIYILIVVSVCLLILSASFIIKLWIGDKFIHDQYLITMMGVFVLFTCWNSIFAVFVNGLNKLKLQFVTSLIASVINIPLSIFFVKFFHMDIAGIILGTILSLSLFAIAGPVQVYGILKKN